ncbi:hypothetical protein MAPG_00196 [Magnaporthiopsis poae ATCC 64411]|uniref:Uncharacterized protein n=1 Tax=Magnaporthiopsis poae (strain ATCC 64411 / 73-15) TaxID=644358 RepID=A0A0C4DKC8_MAGP6|nr:hypothetical protein MAPG_00196 [Magnaporthiopsis poae ATCC 64411]
MTLHLTSEPPRLDIVPSSCCTVQDEMNQWLPLFLAARVYRLRILRCSMNFIARATASWSPMSNRLTRSGIARFLDHLPSLRPGTSDRSRMASMVEARRLESGGRVGAVAGVCSLLLDMMIVHP